MKKLLLIFLLATSQTLFAQTNQLKKVTAACEAFREALINPTKEKLDALITDSISYGHSSGVIDHHDEFVSKLITGKSDYVSIDITDQTIQLYKNTAIVRHKLSATINDNGKPGDIKLLVMLVWVKQHGQWKLAARQAVKQV